MEEALLLGNFSKVTCLMNGWVEELSADLNPKVLKVDTDKALKIRYTEPKTIHSNLDGTDVMMPQPGLEG